MTLEQTIEGIKTMQIRGAATIAEAAAKALVDEAKAYKGTDVVEFEKMLRDAGKKLLATRPTAVSLKNGIRASLKPLFKKPTPDSVTDIEALRSAVIIAGTTFLETAGRALESIAEFGARRIKPGSIIMTHCNSNAALSIIEKAFAQGKVKRVFATESRPWFQGHVTAKRLASKGIPVTLIVDSAVRSFINGVNIVIVGADTIASNGAVINKIGTSQVALCAHEARVPVMVAAETFKFSPETMEGELVEIEERDIKEVADPKEYPGVDIANPVFDATPAEYIDVIVTEKGIISPHAAYQFAAEFGMDEL
jgi:ribose 1,5-bisphosphate isomerase